MFRAYGSSGGSVASATIGGSGGTATITTAVISKPKTIPISTNNCNNTLRSPLNRCTSIASNNHTGGLSKCSAKNGPHFASATNFNSLVSSNNGNSAIAANYIFKDDNLKGSYYSLVTRLATYLVNGYMNEYRMHGRCFSGINVGNNSKNKETM